jgi:hypothetical protein
MDNFTHIFKRDHVFWQFPVKLLDGRPALLRRDFNGFLQSSEATTRIVPQN